MPNRFCLLFVVTLSFCFSCCRGSKLDSVEFYIQEYPDSALTALQGITVRGRGEKARYALLYSMACDKNYIDIKSDSAISVALNWFEKTGDKYRLMLANYYAARVQFNASNFPASIIYSQKALDLAVKNGDEYYEGMTCWLFGDIYFANHNYKKAQDYYSAADAAFSRAGKDRYAVFSKFELAKMHLAMKQCHQCDSVLNTAFPMIDSTDVAALSSFYAVQLRSYAIQKKDKEAISLFGLWSSLPVKADRFSVYGEMALPFYRSGDRQSADKCIELTYKYSSGEQRSAASAFTASILYEDGKYKEAIDSFSKAYDYQNRVAFTQFANSIDDAFSEYYKSEARLRKQQMKNRITLISIVSGLLLLSVLLYYFFKKKSYQEKLAAAKEDIAYITQMNRDSLKNFNKFLQIRQNLIDDVLAGYGDEKSSRHAGLAYDVIDDKIENLKTGGDGFKKLVKDLNDCFEDIVKKLREIFPNISREDYHILVYYFSGFSQETVSLLTGVPVQKLYNLKRNWVGKFDQLPSPDRGLFLTRMNTSKYR